ncbi:unnamed protein product [Polarella glacialis]|uniref:Uncharacterized protein n=1 Tax=Polarella glacialis TaxID=89957 RepID=A0A813KT71_POLGL|nr:unnamed protein product [Polarella glacialis]CAE8714516.1 unnamed protein product [Polarella glacialis]
MATLVGTWIARLCNGKRPLHEVGAHTPKPRCNQVKETHRSKPKPSEVPIDRMTVVPADLYKSLVLAGSRARARGQHSLQKDRASSSEPRQSRLVKPSLVRNKSYYA